MPRLRKPPGGARATPSDAAPPKRRLTKKAASTAAAPEPLPIMIPGFPREDGPPEIANGAGSKLLKDKSGEITLTLDNGSFRWLWETCEAQALRHWQHYRTLPSADAGQRALTAVRNAGHHQYRPPEETMPKKHRPYPSPNIVKPTTPTRKLRRKKA